ncbi:MAG: DUF1361 domain-containing protein [bacterium]|nr:DUF1361 domain-containing protein [bacterium]
MDRIIHNSIFSLDKVYLRYRWLGDVYINDYQLFTIFWNLILALTPLALYFILRKYAAETRLAGLGQKIIAIVLFFVWLLFFPNTAYIITDVRHLLNYCPADSPFKVCEENAWMIMLFFTYSSLGWISFYYLLKQMAKLAGEIFSRFISRVFIALAIPVTALGVLVGLFNRFNSLDAILFPVQFIKVIGLYFSDINYFLNWLIFTVFLYLLYLAGDVIFRKV